MKKLLLILFVFSGFDYLAFNLIHPDATYRVIQIIVQLSICVVVLFYWGWKPVLSFLILWWFWVCDWMYYGIDLLLKLFGTGFEHGLGFWNVTHNYCNWAGFTPAGLMGIETTFAVLLIQSVIGIALVILLYQILKITRS